MKKVVIIGLDSVPPELLFERFIDKLPNLKALYDKGAHAVLETCHPPITVPAWMVMFTGKNPGRLGLYGFRHRKGHSYNEGYIVNSQLISDQPVWEIIGKSGLKSCVIGMPPSYPPKTINGSLITDFLTPSSEKQYSYPPELKGEIEKLYGKYVFDVTFRVEDRGAIKKQLFEMTENRFKIANYLAKNKEWDLFVLHEIGFDRLHHAFWKFFDPTHPKYKAGNEYESIAEEYYKMVDQKIGELLQTIGPEASVFVLSDHGSKAMKGAFCVNQWLIREGYLKLKSEPNGVIDIDKAEVDWSKTKAWGWGGYYARIFFNVKGREPQGVIEQANFASVKKELKERLMKIPDPSGRVMKNIVFEPEEVYGTAKGDKPDFMVYFDDLDWRSAGTIGHESMYLSENDTGPDDSVHSMDGVFIYKDSGSLNGKDLGRLNVVDIAPTILALFGQPIPQDMEGKVIELN